jgi:hypothetical protein
MLTTRLFAQLLFLDFLACNGLEFLRTLVAALVVMVGAHRVIATLPFGEFPMYIESRGPWWVLSFLSDGDSP